MGYQDVTLYRLKFENRAGLEVTAEGLSTGDLLDVMELSGMMPDAAAAAKGLTAEMRAPLDRLMTILAGSLVSWNVEDRNGAPVPTDVEGLKSLKLALVMDIITAWVSAQSDVDTPLPTASSSGATRELETSIPMESHGN